MGKLNTKQYIYIFILVVFVALATYQSGKNNGFNDYRLLLEKATISECGNSGCYINIPHEDGLFIYCDNNYICITEPMTEEIKKRDEELNKFWKETLDSLPKPIQ